MTTALLDQPAELTWGSQVFLDAVEPDLPWQFIALSDESDLGNPEPLVETIRSMLTVGEKSERTGWGNRELPVRIKILATDGQAMAQAENALWAELSADQVAPLIWTPPLLEAWPMALDVDRVDMVRAYDNIGERWDHRERFGRCRIYDLTFHTLPFARDTEPTVVPALPVPEDPDTPARIVLDPCDSKAGWTATPCHTNHWNPRFIDNGTSGGNTWVRVYASNTYTGSLGWLAINRPGTLVRSGRRYITVDFSRTSNPPVMEEWEAKKLTIVVSGKELEPAGQEPVSSGITRFYFDCIGLPDTLTSFQARGWWEADAWNTSSQPTRRLALYEIGADDRIGINGTSGFQVPRTVLIEGAAETQASLLLDAGPNPLVGSTALIYTGRSPAVSLRALRVNSGTVTPSATAMSGATNGLTTPMTVRIPVGRLRNDTTYTIPWRLSFTGQRIIHWSARMVAGTATWPAGEIPGSDVVVEGDTLVINTTADPWRIHDIAALQLPIIGNISDPTHAIDFTLSLPSGSDPVGVDEGWALDTGNGAYTVVHEPSAYQLSAIEIRSPELGAPKPEVVGTWLDYGRQDISRLTTLGTHRWLPGLLHIFTATDLAKYAPCSATYYRRYPFHAGPDLPVDAADG
ncbi:hypothetical protein [Pimelobacter simplex]|uniref:hypothetical protein n=1 Tax=Nocardioides simplex TaxID=2045 RepID=UPI0011448DDF|nr:hypothetical protein [Pimelobacter simplex]GEB13537.1 hypothetical protein NSI01_18520 [Pimelobacter simplex]